jgi:ligand-binding sensor domain-containing protein/two-component sensor histidine kinase
MLLSTECTGHGQNQYSFVHYNTITGLASHNTTAVVQDKTGFIWVATTNGLQRYDGTKFITFNHSKNNRYSLPENSIKQIVIDNTGRLWLLFASGRVGIFNTVNFIFTEVTLNITGVDLARWFDKKIIVTGSGRIFYLLCSFHIYEFNEKQRSFSCATPFFHIVPGMKVWDIFEDISTKKFWLGGNFGLAVFNSRTGNLSYWEHNIEKEPAIDLFGNCKNADNLYIDNKNRIWFSSWPPRSNAGLVYAYDLKNNTPLLNAYNFLPDLKTYYTPRGIVQQKNGAIWIKGDNLFAKYVEGEKRFEVVSNEFINEQSIDYGEVKGLTEDREGNIWVATNNNGLYRFNPSRQSFNNIRPWNNLLNKAGDRAITSFFRTSKNTILAGTWGIGLHEYDSNLNSLPLQASALKKIEIVWDMSLSNDRRTVWIGTQPGIFTYDQVSRTVSYYDPFILKNQTVRQVQEDNLGNLWIGTHSKGVYVWPKQYKEKRLANRIIKLGEIPDKTAITSILTDSEGHIWIGASETGAYLIDPTDNKIIYHFINNGPPGRQLLNDHVSSLFQYDDSTIIILAGGLNIYHTKTHRISSIPLPEELSSDIAGIAKDKKGHVWISAANGICKFNWYNRSFILFDRTKGITNDNFEPGSSFALPDGRLLFGCSNQFIAFDPVDIQPKESHPDIILTDFKIRNKSFRLDSILKLKEVNLCIEQNYLNIEFATCSYGNNYSIVQKLEGRDEDWKPTEGNHVLYPYLPPGRYTLLLKSKDSEGNEGKHITSLTFMVHPPFWRSWWFITIIVLLTGGIVFALYKQKVTRLLEIERVRTRVARDLHDDIGSSLSTINILSKVAAQKMKTDSLASKEYMQKISESSGRIMESMDDIIWSINPVNDTMGKVLVRIKEFVAETLEPKEINFIFLVPDEVKELKLDMEARRDFFLIFKEAINNISKYSEAQNVRIEMKKLDNDLNILIVDDGKGFNFNEKLSRYRGGHGLQNMKNRAQQLKGILNISSTPGNGTRIHLNMKIA